MLFRSAEAGTQKEHRQVALAAQEEILKHFPSLREYWQEEIEIGYTLKKTELNTKTRTLDDSQWWKFWS